jgi:cytokinin riboside 5'-monophosphate phosphoribohydrolase
MISTICVFCSSSEDLDSKYYQVADDLGKMMGKESINLIHGAGSIGLMGVLMKSAISAGCKVTGVVPERLNRENIVSDKYQTLIVTPDMKERKEYMRANSDAFIALPGGFGTLEEFAEVITLKQLKYHNKPIVILNSFGFYDNLLRQFEVFYDQNFAIKSYRNLYYVTQDLTDAFDYMKAYKPENIYDKYLRE